MTTSFSPAGGRPPERMNLKRRKGTIVRINLVVEKSLSPGKKKLALGRVRKGKAQDRSRGKKQKVSKFHRRFKKRLYVDLTKKGEACGGMTLDVDLLLLSEELLYDIFASPKSTREGAFKTGKGRVIR